MSNIEQIVKGAQGLKSPSMGVTKGYSLQFDTVRPDDTMGKAFHGLSKLATWATQQYKEEPEEDKSRELFASLPMDKQRELLNNGDVGIEVNNTSRKGLKQLFGKMAADAYMTSLFQMVHDGHLGSPDDVQQAYRNGYRTFMNSQKAKYNIDDNDEDFLKGFSGNVHSGMMEIMKIASNKSNEKNKASIEFGYVQNFNNLSRDNVTGLMDGTVADMTWTAFRDGVDTLKIPTDASGVNIANQILTNASQQIGGYKFLEDSRNLLVVMNGRKGTIEEHIGKDKYELLMERSKSYQIDYTTAQGAEMARDLAKVSNINSEMTQEERVATVDKWQRWTNTWFPSEKNNQYREQLKRASLAIDSITMQQVAGERQRNLKKSEEQAKDHAYVMDVYRAMNGEKGVQLLAENRPDYSENDILRAAGVAIQEVKKLPPEEQPTMFAKMLAADQLGGGIASMLKGDFDKALREFNSAVANKEVPEEMPNFDWAYKVYKEIPEVVFQHYPDLVPLFSTMNLMDSHGYNRNQLIANRIDQQALKDSGLEKQSDQYYQTAIKDKDWGVDYPASSMGAAKLIFTSTYASTGNAELATEATDKFLKDSTWQYEGESKGFWSGLFGGSNDVYGRIPKNNLRITEDPDSYKQGAEALTAVISEIKKVNKNSITVKQNGDKTLIIANDGSWKRELTSKDLNTIYNQIQNVKAVTQLEDSYQTKQEAVKYLDKQSKANKQAKQKAKEFRNPKTYMI